MLKHLERGKSEWALHAGDAVVVTRFDVYLKADLHSLLGDAATIDGFRLLWREAGGHWRHHSDHATSKKTFAIKRERTF